MDEAADPRHNPSRARDHLANERTYLAWLRTALAVMALGLGIAGFANSRASSVAAGAILVGVGAVGVFFGTVRYRQVNREIESGRYDTGSRATAAFVASSVLTVTVVAALVVLVIGRK